MIDDPDLIPPNWATDERIARARIRAQLVKARQRRILDLRSRGLTITQLAKQLGISRARTQTLVDRAEHRPSSWDRRWGVREDGAA